jgi:peptidoglycan/LPS O-acetylase OafA/YrhL
MNRATERNIGLDLLRGASILYIVGYWHMLEYTNAISDHDNLLTSMLKMVTLGVFVFISGYLIGGKEIVLQKKTLLLFYARRFLRIYPLYLLAIGLFAFLNSWTSAESVKAVFSIGIFVKPPPITLWFISMLLFFYIISPFLILACRATYKGMIKIFALVGIGLFSYEYFTGLLDSRVLVYFPAFFSGVFVANNSAGWLAPRNFLVLLPATLPAYFFANQTDYSELKILVNMPVIAIWSLSLFLLLKDLVVTHKKGYLAIIYLSYSSYCMYLFHRPIIDILKKGFFPDGHLFQLIYLFFFCLPVVVGCSLLIQRSYDATIGMITRMIQQSKETSLKYK